MKLFALVMIPVLLLVSCEREPHTDPEEEYNCTTEGVIAKGDRKVGMDILNLTETNSFDQNIAMATDLGIDFLPIHFDWNFIESSPNSYEDTYSYLELIALYASQSDLKLNLTLRPIDIPGNWKEQSEPGSKDAMHKRC